MQGRLSVDSLKSAGNGAIHSPVSNPSNTKQTKKGKQKQMKVTLMRPIHGNL